MFRRDLKAQRPPSVPAFRSVRLGVCLFAVVLSAFASSCTPNQKIIESANQAASATPESKPAAGNSQSSVESDIEAMRNADFNYIFLFRRRDGSQMDADDKKFFGAHTPPETNRRIISDGGKAILIGSNYRWDPTNFKMFTERYNLEDYSKPENEIINVNSNSKANH